MTTVFDLQKKYLPTLAPEDFFLILSHATQKEKISLLAHPEYFLNKKQLKQAEILFERRLQHEPVAYLTGQKEFYGRSFYVTKNTLIPRPETELFIEKILAFLIHEEKQKNKISFDIVDIGTGSGNIIITLAKEILLLPLHHSYFRFFGLDISQEALRIAQKNARSHNVTKITFLTSDLLKKFSLPKKKEHHAIIIANLPYLSEKIYQASDADVRLFEPRNALVSGIDGLDHYRKLLQTIKSTSHYYLSTTFFLEISPEQSHMLKEIIVTLFPSSSPIIYPDLSGKSRLVQGTV